MKFHLFLVFWFFGFFFLVFFCLIVLRLQICWMRSLCSEKLEKKERERDGHRTDRISWQIWPRWNQKLQLQRQSPVPAVSRLLPRSWRRWFLKRPLSWNDKDSAPKSLWNVHQFSHCPYLSQHMSFFQSKSIVIKFNSSMNHHWNNQSSFFISKTWIEAQSGHLRKAFENHDHRPLHQEFSDHKELGQSSEQRKCRKHTVNVILTRAIDLSTIRTLNNKSAINILSTWLHIAW